MYFNRDLIKRHIKKKHIQALVIDVLEDVAYERGRCFEQLMILMEAASQLDQKELGLEEEVQ